MFAGGGAGLGLSRGREPVPDAKVDPGVHIFQGIVVIWCPCDLNPTPCPPPPTSPPLTQRAGNCLLSYNNRPATDVIPLLSPVIVPSARILGPVINQIAASPIRTTVEVRHASRDSSSACPTVQC